MKYQIYSQPAVEPISLSEAKDHLRIDGTDEDTYLATIITAARRYCEQYCNRAFITQTWKQYPTVFTDGMKLSINPVQSVSSITYYDVDGASQTLASNQYQVDLSADICRVYEAVNVDFPDVQDEKINPITITYVSGYGDAATDVPMDIRHAIKFMIAHFFQNREGVNVMQSVSNIPMPESVKVLLNNYRLFYEA
jgi:uncharacterized phiE125 gp8 family phage protein